MYGYHDSSGRDFAQTRRTAKSGSDNVAIVSLYRTNNNDATGRRSSEGYREWALSEPDGVFGVTVSLFTSERVSPGAYPQSALVHTGGVPAMPKRLQCLGVCAGAVGFARTNLRGVFHSALSRPCPRRLSPPRAPANRLSWQGGIRAAIDERRSMPTFGRLTAALWRRDTGSHPRPPATSAVEREQSRRCAMHVVIHRWIDAASHMSQR